MKKSTNRFSTQRWDNFAADINDQEDDFLLAELQTIPDDTGLTITPLNHIVDDDDDDDDGEDAIDRLLANSGFDTQPAQTANKTAAFAAVEVAVEPVNFIDHPVDPVTDIPTDEQNHTAFVVEPLPEKHFQAAQTGAAVPTDFRVDAFISDYLAMRQPEHTTDSLLESGNKAILPEDPIVQRNNPEPFMPEHPDDAVDDASTLHQLTINQAYLEKQLAQLQKKSSAAMRTAYVALAVGMAILMSIAVLYPMISGMKSDIAKLTGLIEIIKEDLDTTLAETPVEN